MYLLLTHQSSKVGTTVPPTLQVEKLENEYKVAVMS